MNFIISKKAQKRTDTTVDYYDELKAKSAYRKYKNSRVDKSHLEKYPQYVKPSDYYNYLLSKVTWI
ncbi:hypothetical protein [Staphylococcus intermedius]|uniref:Uncharacterized protein n=1 Tax=Staphylococcus intermedius NCTC 11048 TaxID=1141106 RepID=A0A380G6G7_STAIN|nr:hypothetical protein [Staphylococcus intermedius]PNZ49330.1 hypothetical protein CD138_12905 [Staphylococcus intermedius NCTC 11048]SUM46352.1 Uncharacterised protein [Staphylococcus intermedius NCTC 11048]